MKLNLINKGMFAHEFRDLIPADNERQTGYTLAGTCIDILNLHGAGLRQGTPNPRVLPDTLLFYLFTPTMTQKLFLICHHEGCLNFLISDQSSEVAEQGNKTLSLVEVFYQGHTPLYWLDAPSRFHSYNMVIKYQFLSGWKSLWFKWKEYSGDIYINSTFSETYVYKLGE